MLRIGYVLNSVFGPERPDFVVNGYVGEGPAMLNDAQLLAGIEKELKKKKTDKAVFLLDQLIRRYPDRTDYQARKKSILADANKS
jgi:hypothetical protein